MTPPLPTALPAAYLRRSSATKLCPPDCARVHTHRLTDRNAGNSSRELQEAAVRRMAGADVTLYVDWGISGRKDARPEYQRLKAAIRAGQVSSLCAYSLSRLGRNTRELLDLVALCRDRGVPIRTEVESINTEGAMGAFMFTIMAAVGQLEAEMGQERAASARAARAERHTAAGLIVPAVNAVYGRKHVSSDGLTRIVPDSERPIEPVLAAYREAGTVRGACELLQRRGIPAPHGGTIWWSSALARILREWIPDELPEPNARGLRRPSSAHAARYAGLLQCHCGRTMTPNVQRGQYYCAGGRDSGSELHGKMSVTERALTAVLRPEAERYARQGVVRFHDSTAGEREGLERRKERVLNAYLDGKLPEARWKSETATLDAKLATMTRQDRTIAAIGLETIPAWSDVAGTNAHLRRIWTRVTLDAAMRPTVEWGVPKWAYDEAAMEAYAAEGNAKSASEPTAQETAWLSAHNGLPF